MFAEKSNVLAKVTGRRTEPSAVAPGQTRLHVPHWKTDPALPRSALCAGAISELPAEGSAHAKIVLIGSYRRLAVEVFIHVKTPPEVFHDLYPQIGSRL